MYLVKVRSMLFATDEKGDAVSKYLMRVIYAAAFSQKIIS